jgi:hypothetical protein
MTFGWTWDQNTQQTFTRSQGGSHALAGTFVAGSSFAGLAQISGRTVRAAGLGANQAFLSNGQSVIIKDTTSYNGYYEISNVTFPTATTWSFEFTLNVDWAGSEGGKWRLVEETPPFVLGTSTLGGAAYVDRFMDLTSGGAAQLLGGD